MNVDLNNVRKRAAYALDDLTKKLNSGILKEKEGVLEEDENGKDVWREGDLLVYKDDIQKHMDDLNELIWTMCCCFDEDGDPNFQTVFEEVEKNGGLCRFNEQEQE